MKRARALLVLSMSITACSPSAQAGPEMSADQCRDGVDNDANGLVDCGDISCGSHAWCRDAGPAADAGPVLPDSGPRPDVIIACSDPIDVVFVIDVSTSMADEVDGIRRGVDSIFAAARALTSSAQFSLVVFVDDVMAVDGCAPFATASALQTELASWLEFTSTNGQPGGSDVPNADCAENSLDAIYAAATTCPWRTGATRILVHVTDDTFAERPAILSESFFGGGVPVARTYAETASALVDRQIRVGAFAAPGAGEYCGAGTSPDVGRGFHAPYLGAPSLPSATRGRVWSIRDVRAGTLDMAAAISEFTADEYCTLY